MKSPLRHIAVVGFVMFALLFGSTSWVQYFSAQSLKDNPFNSRTLIEELSRHRGPILVAGSPIASSEPVDDVYKYQRQYGGKYDPKMYSAITGFYSVVNGATGMEKAENEMLSGSADALFYQKIGSLFTGQQPMGAAVELTIDPKAQAAAYKGLGGQRGAVVALDPKTGRILAMASTPGWDPNKLATHNTKDAAAAYQNLITNDANPAYNRAIGGNLYPPGSTFKLVTAAAALETGDYHADTQLDAPAALDLPQTSAKIRNSSGGACGSGGKATLEHSLTVSCNTSFADLGMKLGDRTLSEQAEKFGFGRDFRVPLSVTSSTFPADPNPPQLAQSALGQFEVRATPMQMAMVASGIANDGKLMTPQLVSTVRNGSNLDLISEPAPKEFSRPMSAANAKELGSMMVSVVENGTGRVARMPGIDVAAKTGTAQHAKGAAPHAWFTSFAPADDPQVAVAVVVENGGNAGNEASGARVAGPIAKSVMEAVINS